MGGIGDIFDRFYDGPLSQALTSLWNNTVSADCFRLDPELNGRYSGVHLGDNVTEKQTREFETRVGHADMQLKFSDIEGGWVFPWQELKILKRFAQTMLVKWEPFIPPYGGLNWEDIKPNHTFIDKIIPQQHYQMLSDLALVAVQGGPDLPTKIDRILRQHNIDKLVPVDYPAILAELAARTAAGRNFAAEQFDVLLKNYGLTPAQVAAAKNSLLAAAETESQAVAIEYKHLLQRAGLDRELGPDKFAALVTRLVSRTRGGLSDVSQQFVSIMREYNIDIATHQALLKDLAAAAVKQEKQLDEKFVDIFAHHRLDTRRTLKFDRLLERLSLKAKGGLDNDVLEFDLVLRQHKLATYFRGEYDEILKEDALRAKMGAVPILDIFGPEMNGFGGGRYWYPFGVDSVKYVLAYRHNHDVKQEAGGKNLLFVWNPHVVRETEKDFTDFYPGDAFVDIVAFDVYTEKESESPKAHLENAIKTMDTYFINHGYDAARLAKVRYGVAEWGARNYRELDEMLTYLESNRRIKFAVYYNVESATGDYRMTAAMQQRYRRYLAALAGDNYSFAAPLTNNPDIRAEQCSLPVIPPPNLTLREIPPGEFLSPEELEQKVCLPAPVGSQPGCLSELPPGWTPENDSPPRTLPESDLYPVEQGQVSQAIGFVYDYGTHQYLLNAQRIQQRIDEGSLPVETLGELLRAGCFDSSDGGSGFRTLQAWAPEQMAPEKLFAVHTELIDLNNISPEFGVYLRQPKLFWENLLIIYGLYVQKLIENNDQAGLRESIVMGEYLLKAIAFQKAHEAQTFSKETFSPSKYRLASLLLNLGEAYSQLRDAPVPNYQKGLAYVEEAIEKFIALGKNSGIDYFSITKGVLTAADLHTKVAQQELLATHFRKAKAEYEVARYLYDRVARLDYNNGVGLSVEPFGAGLLSQGVHSPIRISATAVEIDASLARNVGLKFINEAEAVASSRQLFQMMHGMALIKQAGHYMEFPFTPFQDKGYEVIIQAWVQVAAGLKEVEAGSPFADHRYFVILAHMLSAKLAMSFIDSLAYSTSEMPEPQARETYRRALAMLKDNLPDLLMADEWAALEQTRREATLSDQAAVDKDMIELRKATKAEVPAFGGKLVEKDFATPDLIAAADGLLKQTYTKQNYRLDLTDRFVKLAQRQLGVAEATFAQPNIYGRDDRLKDKAPILWAELDLLKTGLDLRESKYIKFEDKSLLNRTGLVPDPAQIGQIKTRLNGAVAALPDSSYLKIEASLMGATLELSLKSPATRTPAEQAARRTEIYEAIGLLAARPPVLNSRNTNRSYRTIVALEKMRPRIMAQPEPNRTLLLHELQIKTSLAYITLAADLVKTFPGEMEEIYKDRDKGSPDKKANAKTVIKKLELIMSRPQAILLGLAAESSFTARHSIAPLLYNVHDFRVEVYHQLAIVFAVVNDKPGMQHYLMLAKEENLRSDSRFNVLIRSWILNRFAIPKPRSSRKGTAVVTDVFNDDLRPLLGK